MNRGDSAELICHACTGDLTVGEEYLQCGMKTCGKLYHRLCIGLNLSMEEKDTWVCPECSMNVKKGGRNCNTPVGTPVTVKNIVSRNKSGTPVNPSCPPVLSPVIAPEFQLMSEQMALLSGQLTSAVSTIAQYQLALADYAIKFETLHDRITRMELALVRTKTCTVSVACGPDRDLAVREVKPKRKRKSTVGQGHPLAQNKTELPLENSKDAESLELNDSNGGPVVNLESPSRDMECADVAGSDWHAVRSRKKRFSSVLCTGGPGVTALRAVEYRKYIHLWNMVSGPDEISAYLKSLFPENACTVDELKPKGEYRSYKIGVPAAQYESCLSAAVWPANARVRPWLFRKPQTKKD